MSLTVMREPPTLHGKALEAYRKRVRKARRRHRRELLARKRRR